MKKYSTQICLVYEQAIPNVTPVVDEAIRPENVILCTPNTMLKNAEVLDKFFESKGISTRIVEFEDEYNLSSLKEGMLELAAEFEDCENVGVNITGGNDIMTIAAQLVFGENGFDCFYVIAEKDQIVMVSDQDHAHFEIQDKLKLEDYFAVHGYKVSNPPKRNLFVTKESRELFDTVLRDTRTYADALGTLNYLAAEAEYNRTTTVYSRISGEAWPLLKLFNDHGSIYYFDDKKVSFSGEDGREFCRGFWLEDHVYLELKKVDNEIGLQDFACSVEIENKHGVPNEVDAAFIYNNHLYLIECKTARMDDKGSNVIYKIDTIKNYAGMQTTSIIATFKGLERYDQQRAEDLGVKVISGDALRNFSQHILKMLKPEITESHR